jgi:hypothetical protein
VHLGPHPAHVGAFGCRGKHGILLKGLDFGRNSVLLVGHDPVGNTSILTGHVERAMPDQGGDGFD